MLFGSDFGESEALGGDLGEESDKYVGKVALVVVQDDETFVCERIGGAVW